ncbi:DUF6035 family protein [Bosea sp. (in: a-proteobacteria)]|uniref:DUF6035 family protein n=1 Tax=Bosea sp. (in: a-proteobacteria) TaxID=1871050 RepID=UPI0031FE4CE1
MLTISSDALMGMSKDDYQIVRRLATRARLERRPRYVCGLCGHAVYGPREGRTGQPYWKHHPGAAEGCSWWTGTPSGVDAVSGRQFDGAQESPLHAKIKNIVGELLTADHRTKPESVVVDEYLITEGGRRRPDVRAVYDQTPLVVEVQLATTQIPIIIQREDFYDSEAYRLLWLTWNFEPPAATGRLLSSFEDIFYSHNKNLFSMDDETVQLSRQRNEVTLRAFWIRDGLWQSKLVCLGELNWLSSGRAYAVAPEPLWHEDFRARWRTATGEYGTRWPERGALLVELVSKLSLPASGSRVLEEADIDALINCLLSLLDGHPVGSRQKKLVEVLNTFLNVERRHRFARLIRRFSELTGRNEELGTKSVRDKLATAFKTAQDDPQSLAGRIALALFPDTFASGRTVTKKRA